MRSKKTEPAVFAVTAARSSLTDDVKKRQRKYVIAMTVRTTCFLLCVVTPGPLKWVFFVGALILPYLAVVAANAGRESGGPAVSQVVLPTRLELTAAKHERSSRQP
jgi:hypothetical protein